MSFSIYDSNLTIEKPSTGWPQVYAGDVWVWQVDVSPVVSAPDSYNDMVVHRISDGSDETSNWSLSGTGSVSGNNVILRQFTVPSGLQDVEYAIVFSFVKDSNTIHRVIPIRAYEYSG